MWLSTAPLSLIRYLVVWRIQGRLVRLPPCLPAAISTLLGTLVAERLPTPQARSWHKTLNAAQQQAAQGQFAPAPWPIASVILAPPGKRTYGEDEIILWELKLLGPHADHGLFLELLLPAIEAAAVTRDPRWFANYSLWGRFAVQAIYVADGLRWQPLVEEGRLNLRLRPTAGQWANGLWGGDQPRRPVTRLRWVTPLALGRMPDADVAAAPRAVNQAVPRAEVPTLEGVVLAFLRRAAQLLEGKSRVDQDVWSLLDAEERAELRGLCSQFSVPHQWRFFRPPGGWPGAWIGEQTFHAPLPLPVLPYLNLAAVLHVGDYTHYGCGTFRLR